MPSLCTAVALCPAPVHSVSFRTADDGCKVSFIDTSTSTSSRNLNMDWKRCRCCARRWRSVPPVQSTSFRPETRGLRGEDPVTSALMAISFVRCCCCRCRQRRLCIQCFIMFQLCSGWRRCCRTAAWLCSGRRTRLQKHCLQERNRNHCFPLCVQRRRLLSDGSVASCEAPESTPKHLLTLL